MPRKAPSEAATTRWAGVPLEDRRRERRAELIDVAFDLFGTSGDAAVTVRAVCRGAGMHNRYFYESFRDVDELLGAVYDRVAEDLQAHVAGRLEEVGDDTTERIRVVMYDVLRFASADSRRGRILFTGAITHPVLVERRQAAEQALLDGIFEFETRTHPAQPTLGHRVRAALFTGAMVELMQQWLSGDLGTDLDAVVDAALPGSLALLGVPATT